MTTIESLNEVVRNLPQERLREVLDFAHFLTWQEEREEWRRLGQAQFARAYGPDEPEYSEADLKSALDR